MQTFITAALAFTGVALAAPVTSDGPSRVKTARDSVYTGYVQSADFTLSVTGNANLAGYLIKNAHIDGGKNVLTIMRPGQNTADVAYFNSTVPQKTSGQQKIAFHYAEATDLVPLEVELPVVEGSDVLQVFTYPGAGTYDFYLDANNTLSVWKYQSSKGFFACPTTVGGAEYFTLWYGIGGGASTLPSDSCQSIDLQATF